MRKPTCFIASAFGYKDVDAIYLKAIVPVLRELGVKPLRVDRINHNEKIDSKILELISKCDFGIADLTFARPSVYYEAGFIEGLAKNVIYIARNDHFKQKEADSYGNERIHFDLITKNVISWSNVNELFKSRLKKRVNLILRSVNPKLKESAVENESRQKFKEMSLTAREQALKDLCHGYIQRKRLKPVHFRFIREVYGTKKVRIKFDISESLTQSDLSFYRTHLSEMSADYSLKVVRVFCVFNAVPLKRIEVALPYFHPVGAKVFQYKTVKFIIWDNIDSLHKLTQNLKDFKLE
jgi:hypothetical protein